MRIVKEYRFEAAHRLRFHQGACANIHGHSYKLVVGVDRDTEKEGPETDMVMDFKTLSNIVRGIVEEGDLCGEPIVPFDHSIMLNKDDEICQFLKNGVDDNQIPNIRILEMVGEPTAEYMTKLLVTLIKMGLEQAYEGEEDKPQLAFVEVWETETAKAVWDAYVEESSPE